VWRTRQLRHTRSLTLTLSRQRARELEGRGNLESDKTKKIGAADDLLISSRKVLTGA